MLAVHLPTYRPLTRCGLDELAAHQVTAKPSGGVLFARKQERDQKDEARARILELLTPEAIDTDITVLTMPGMDWRFERKLLGLREGDWFRARTPHRTRLYAVENDRSIYHGAMLRMPGLQHKGSIVKVLPPTAYAERSLSTRWVERYYFGNVDDLMRGEHPYDVAWLDYTGPMSVPRLQIIRKFFAQSVNRILILTVLKARWNKNAVEAIYHAGGHTKWLLKSLPGAVLHEINYQDGASPMTQIAVAKERA